MVGEARACEGGGIIQVAPINNDRLLQGAFQCLEIRTPKFLPLSYHRQGIGTLSSIQGFVTKRHSINVRVKGTRSIHGLRVISTHSSACSKQFRYQHATGGLTQIIGVGFERQPPYRNRPTFEARLKTLTQLVAKHMLLLLVHGVNGAEQLRLIAVGVSSLPQCPHVLGETGTTVAAAGVNEGVANS